jgi:hypothetical protein
MRVELGARAVGVGQRDMESVLVDKGLDLASCSVTGFLQQYESGGGG